MNYQIVNNNFKFIDQEKINKSCIEYLDFIINESLPNILSFIDDDLYKCKLFIRNKINFSFNSNNAYFDFLNTKIKTIFNLQQKFMNEASLYYFLYNLTLKDFADLIEFNNNVNNVSDNNNNNLFKAINDAIKSDNKNKNIRITYKDYVGNNNKQKINLKDFDLENNLNNEINNFQSQNNLNFENNNFKSKTNLNDNILNNSLNSLNNIKTTETSNNNNNIIIISENEKNNFSNYPKGENEIIFQQKNFETIIEPKKENEEFIFYERNFYYEKEMKNWFQTANKKLSEN